MVYRINWRAPIYQILTITSKSDLYVGCAYIIQSSIRKSYDSLQGYLIHGVNICSTHIKIYLLPMLLQKQNHISAYVDCCLEKPWSYNMKMGYHGLLFYQKKTEKYYYTKPCEQHFQVLFNYQSKSDFFPKDMVKHMHLSLSDRDFSL